MAAVGTCDTWQCTVVHMGSRRGAAGDRQVACYLYVHRSEAAEQPSAAYCAQAGGELLGLRMDAEHLAVQEDGVAALAVDLR